MLDFISQLGFFPSFAFVLLGPVSFFVFGLTKWGKTKIGMVVCGVFFLMGGICCVNFLTGKLTLIS